MTKAKSLLDINHQETYAPHEKVMEYMRILAYMEKNQPEALTDFLVNEIQTNDAAEKLIMKFKAIGADTKITKSAFLFLLMIINNDIDGKLWAYTTQEICEKTLQPLDIIDILNYFPEGLPTEKQYNDIWQANNTQNHNLIDQPRTYGLKQFIQFRSKQSDHHEE